MKRKFLVLILVLSLLFSSTVWATEASLDTASNALTEAEFDSSYDFMGLVAKFVQQNYLYDLTYEEILNSMYKGMFSELDDYSVYFTPEEYSAFSTSLSGEFSGVGIQIINEGDNVVVVTPLSESPAEAAGILAKDIIRYVDGTDITGYTTDAAANLIRGVIGTTVVLGIERNNQIIYYSIVRDNIVVSSVQTKIQEDGIGYIKITQFNDNTVTLLTDQMTLFLENKIDKLVIDLRNNPGGSLTDVISILDIFVPAGPLAYVIKADGTETEYVSHFIDQSFELAVLVNEGSASASEIFAGAIQDRKVGTIIGTKTFGKGVVQTLYPLRDGSAMKLTTAEYLTAGRNHVQGIGITPDIIIENKTPSAEVDTTDIPLLNKTRKPDLGTVGLDVLAAEKILDILGYKVTEIDGVFDAELKTQITKFQADENLFPYGVLDFTTQDALTHALENLNVIDTVDLQLEKALEILR